MQSLYKMLETRKVFGEEIPLNYKPTFRSSAIFTVMEEEHLHTRILFMGYWLLKRKIQHISMLLNLRDASGQLILRKHLEITTSQAYRIELAEFLQELPLVNAPFSGSLELEIYSSVDLVYPYPAFVVNYYNASHCTAVHSVGRIYNDLEDLEENDRYKVKESGFDIYSSAHTSGFFSFTNGAQAAENTRFEIEIENHAGQKTTSWFAFEQVKPYETKLICINDYFENLPRFLNEQSGTLKIDHNLKGMFPRFIVGNKNARENQMNITHSYYDSSNVKDESAYWNRLDEAFLDSTIAIPIYTKNDRFTKLVIYPIFSPSQFSLSASLFDQQGNFVAFLENIFQSKEANQAYASLDFNELIAAHGLEESPICAARIECHWNNKEKIPTRVKFGLNIGVKDHIPCNICFAPQLGNPAILKKKHAFRWSPILNHHDSELIITNSSSLKIYEQKAVLQANFHREDDNEQLQRQYVIPPFGIASINVNTDAELSQFLQNKSGWVTFTSENPNINGWYFDFTSSGIVAGDHIF